MSRIAVLMVVLMTLITGCVSEENASPIQNNSTWTSELSHVNHSNQHTNVYPMSVGNNTDVSVNGSVNFHIMWRYLYHEPMLWEKGNLNLSILHTEGNESVVLWSYEPTNTNSNYTFNELWLRGNVSLIANSEGSDDLNDDKPGDWFIVNWRVEVFTPMEVVE